IVAYVKDLFQPVRDVTVLRDGQHVITRPLSGLAIPEIVELMVGRKLSDHGIFRSESTVSGEALGVSGLKVTRNSP
ncbi:D-xylose ABC transporter ATP-binding protein, partial [Rhizobium ruizarguesonis]